MEVVIVGAPNVGKSLLVINFSQYLGVREIQLEEAETEGTEKPRHLTFDRARRDLVSLHTPKTTQIQIVPVQMPVNRQPQRLLLADTPGINDGVAVDPEHRRQIALTLERLLAATVILHVIDASRGNTRRSGFLGAFDTALAEWGRQLDRYALVAHKMDRPGSHESVNLLRRQFPDIPIIPVSSVTRRGYRELKLFLLRVLA